MGKRRSRIVIRMDTAPIHSPLLAKRSPPTGSLPISTSKNSKSDSTQTVEPAPETTARYTVPAALVLILAATFFAYWPVRNGEPLWDDDAHLTRTELQSFSGLIRIWTELGATQQYYPLLHSAFWLEHKLWGDSPLGYHLLNVVLHMTAVLLLYSNLRRLKVPGALLVCALFALHPVMVESVAWISEQKNTLSAVFYLAAMRVYLEFDASRRWTYYGAALALFGLGLLTKTVTATLPAALLVIFWWQRGGISLEEVVLLLPYFEFGAEAGFFTAWFERNLIGASGSDFALTFVQRGLLAGRVVWFYLGKLLWPAKLIFFYSHWEIDPSDWRQWMYPLATIGSLVALWSLRRRTRAPLAGWLLFVGTLIPVLGFLNVYPFIYSYVADHFQYLASIGILVLIGAGVAKLSRRLPAVGQRIVIVVCVIVVATLAALTNRQTQMYTDNITLFNTTLERNPECWMAHNNLGVICHLRGDELQAKKHYDEALKLNPGNAPSHANLALVLIQAGDFDEAIKELQIAIAQKPTFAVAHENLGILLVKKGRLDDGIQQLQIALQCDPRDFNAMNNLGTALLQAHRFSDAIEVLKGAIRLQPMNGDTQETLGSAYYSAGQKNEAIEHYLLALQPNRNTVKAHYNLGNLYSETGQHEKAISHFEELMKLAPDDVEVQNQYGNLLRKANRSEESIRHFKAALKLEPNSVGVYGNLAQALAEIGKREQAIAAAEKGVELALSAGNKTAAESMQSLLKELLSGTEGNETVQRNDAKPIDQSQLPSK